MINGFDVKYDKDAKTLSIIGIKGDSFDVFMKDVKKFCGAANRTSDPADFGYSDAASDSADQGAGVGADAAKGDTAFDAATKMGL